MLDVRESVAEVKLSGLLLLRTVIGKSLNLGALQGCSQMGIGLTRRQFRLQSPREGQFHGSQENCAYRRR